MSAIADAGFLVAFGLVNDQHHDWAVAVAAKLQTPFLTNEAVLAETAYKLRSVAFTLDLIHTGLVRVEFNLTTELDAITSLAAAYHDRQPDLADLCVIRMSELRPRLPVITVDGDFKVYRKNRTEIIPLIAPWH